jgi:hypothetical protein
MGTVVELFLSEEKVARIVQEEIGSSFENFKAFEIAVKERFKKEASSVFVAPLISNNKKRRVKITMVTIAGSKFLQTVCEW